MRALSRKKANRKSTLRNLATSLVLYEQIKTTTAKAKELKPLVEHLINKARKSDLSARRQLLSFLFDENASKKVLEVLVPRYKDIKTGFIKSYKIGRRLGDGAEVTVLELVKVEATPTKKVEAAKKEEPKGKENATSDTKEEDNSKVTRKTRSKKTK